MSVLICSTTIGGCGYVGVSGGWRNADREGHLTEENFNRTIGSSDKARASELMKQEYE